MGDAFRSLANTTGDATYRLRALQAYQRAVALDREFGFASAEKHWGEMELEMGNGQAAARHFEAALAVWPHDLGLIKSAARAYEAIRRPDAGETAE